jgi:methyl-accepting chemotaxis protein
VRVAFGAALVSSAVLAVGAAGCGGGGDTSSAESWADDVCTSIADWKEEIRHAGDDIRAELRSPSTGTLGRIGDSVQSAADATTSLVDDLKGLDAPDVDSGDQAKQQVDAFADQLDKTVEQAKTTVDGIPDSAGLAEIVSALATIGPSLDTLANTGQSALAAVEATGSAIKDGFENADACKPLR